MAINIDVPPVEDKQEALTLMFHHLRLAAAYFEVIPDEFSLPDHYSGFAMREWLDAMIVLHVQMEA